MEQIGFIISILIIIGILFLKDKISKKTIIFSIIGYFILTLLFFILKKTGNIQGENHPLILIYASFLCYLLYTIALYVVSLIWSKILGFQKKINNENNSFINTLIVNKSKIVWAFYVIFTIGVVLGLYGLWLN
ncbi:hypothetical protein [Cochleicola gelatinilyticus]|uniref:Uncharacterized protein n=1 Tax=Cochleicola gelatinilyticus TaxID=1763537 RepID=A0A167HLF6_9FLAO|nr:hypothetical protein [Cochleicola gelatinilyticus]OAB78737.1 hypothetical protein ULVI_09145 [Cochleicola gelatinilyticus]